MKHQALLSSKDKCKNNKSVVCCNFAWLLNLVNCVLVHGRSVTLKVPITTAADDIHKYFFIVFQRK